MRLSIARPPNGVSYAAGDFDGDSRLDLVTAHSGSDNLLLFRGRDALNSYALFLKERGGVLWAARLGLLAVFILHIWLAVRLMIPAKIEICCDINTVANAIPNTMPRYLVRSPISIFSATQFMTSPPPPSACR